MFDQIIASTRRLLYGTLLLAALAFSVNAHATICSPLEDIFYMRCQTGKCAGELRVREALRDSYPRYDNCARRKVIEQFPQEAFDALLNRVKTDAHLNMESKTKLARENGWFQISLHYQQDEKPAADAQTLKAALIDDAIIPKILVVTVDKILAGTNREQLRLQLQSEADQEEREIAIDLLLDLGTLLGMLFIVCATTIRYCMSVRLYFARRNPKLQIAKPLLLQVGLFMIAAFNMSAFWQPAAVVIALPLLLLVWVFEAGFYAFARYGLKAKTDL